MTDEEIKILLPEYVNQSVLAFFQSLPDEARQHWHINFLLKARKTMPNVDHYTTAWGNNITICLGVRQPERAAGTPFLQLRSDGSFYRDFQKYSTANAGDWIKVFSDEMDGSDTAVDAWLSSHSNKLNDEAVRLKGDGRVPHDYVKSADDETAENDMLLQILPNVAALNQILYGPPGTGKTYATIEASLEVLDNAYLHTHRNDRSALKSRFDQLSDEGRIRFVTFHQSFSYEDFVEGLRAESDEASGQLRYEVIDGVFKSLCEIAGAKVTQQSDAPVELGNRKIWKMSLGNTQGSDAGIYDECVQAGYILLGYGGNIDFKGCVGRSDIQQRFAEAGVTLAGPNDYNLTSVSSFVTKMKAGDLVVVSDGNFKFRAIGEISGDYSYKPHPDYDGDYAQMRPVKWLRQYSPSLPHGELLNGQFSQMTLYELRSPTLNRDKLQALLGIQAKAGSEGVVDAPALRSTGDARVLIIDEINRGNVSRIFGELITLIEPSKRAGADEALSVVLPYSKERFSVPDNVYLIGTMNTADRSLSGLDIALRRRFVFREMPPRPELLDEVSVEGVNIGELLRVMNQRIEVLLDRDHCLGHAYFMPLLKDPSLDGLASIFRNQIVPLLQEYFFEDWQRIQWVLNDHRKSPVDQFISQQSTNVQTLFGAEVNVGPNAYTWQVSDEAFERLEAYAGIIDHQATGPMSEIKYEVEHQGLMLRELASGSIEVLRAGTQQNPVKPLLRSVATALGMSLVNTQGNLLTTRGLGRQLIQRLREQS